MEFIDILRYLCNVFLFKKCWENKKNVKNVKRDKNKNL